LPSCCPKTKPVKDRLRTHRRALTDPIAPRPDHFVICSMTTQSSRDARARALVTHYVTNVRRRFLSWLRIVLSRIT
jgi:hypothetical protein